MRVAPRFVYRQRLTRDLIWPYFKDNELSRDAAQLAIRIVELTCPADKGRPSALEVHRGRLHHPRRSDRDYDTWLRGEISGLLRMLPDVAA